MYVTVPVPPEDASRALKPTLAVGVVAPDEGVSWVSVTGVTVKV